MTRLSVLDGPAHLGHVLELDDATACWWQDGVLYREADYLHAHEQHGWVRWFRLSDG